MTSSSLRPRFVLLGIALLSATAASAAGCGSGTASTAAGGGGTGGGTGGGATSSTSSSSSSTTSTSTTSSTTSSGMMWPDCHTCLQSECKTEIDACDAECIAIQACLDAVCAHLSMLGSMDEGACQVACQNLHAGAKQKHLNLVNCAQGGAACMPPCAFYSFDWDQCVAKEASGTCKPLLDACNANADCQSYQSCAASCGTNAECQACASTPEGKSGRQAYESYWQCVETTCLAEAWLPNF